MPERPTTQEGRPCAADPESPEMLAAKWRYEDGRQIDPDSHCDDWGIKRRELAQIGFVRGFETSRQRIATLEQQLEAEQGFRDKAEKSAILARAEAFAANTQLTAAKESNAALVARVGELEGDMRQVAGGAKTLVRCGCLGCLTDDCDHWGNDCTLKDFTLCRIGRTINAAKEKP